MAHVALSGWKIAVQNALEKRMAAIVEEEAQKAAVTVRQRVIEEATTLALKLVEQTDNYHLRPEVSIVIYDKAAK